MGPIVPEEFVNRVKEAMQIADEGVRRWQAAEDLLKQIVSQCPEYAEAKYQLASLWTRGMRNKHCIGSSFMTEVDTHSMEHLFDSVDRLLKEVMKAEPDHPGPYYCYSCWACFPTRRSYTAMQRLYKDAQSRDSRADPQYYIVHSDVADAASEKGDRSLAVDAFYWAHRTGKETGRTVPDSEPAHTFWQEARARWQRNVVNPQQSSEPIPKDVTPRLQTTTPDDIEGILMVLGGRITHGPDTEVDTRAIGDAVHELETMYPGCVFTEKSLDLYPDEFRLTMKVTSAEQRVFQVNEDLLGALARRGLKVRRESKGHNA